MVGTYLGPEILLRYHEGLVLANIAAEFEAQKSLKRVPLNVDEVCGVFVTDIGWLDLGCGKWK